MKSFLTLLIACAFVSSCNKEPTKPYTLDTCLISGKKLGEHGTPYVFSIDGQEIKLCCESCLEEFNSNANKLLKEIAAKSKTAK